MNEADVVERVLALDGDSEATGACTALAVRFRAAFQRANPDLSAAQIAAYDRTFAEHTESLRAAVYQARLVAARDALSKAELDVLTRVVGSADTVALFLILQKLVPILRRADQEIFAEAGVTIHVASAEAAIETAE